MHCSKCAVCTKSVGWIGLFVNLLLSLLKLFAGVVAGSQALIADSMYSAKDVITSVLIIIGLKVSSKPIDKDHMYGHGKIEFVLSLVISVVFIFVTGLILYYTIDHFFQGTHQVPHIIALVVSVFAMIVNIFIYKYTSCVAKQINSPMVKTLAMHQWADMMSSAAVAMGIIGAHYMGLVWLDNLIAVFETLHLLYLGGEVFWDAYRGLMDYSAPEEVMDQIKEEALAVEKVSVITNLKTRLIGQGLWIDIDIGLDPEMDVGEAYKVTKQVERNISNVIDHIASISVRFESDEGLPDESLILTPIVGAEA